MTSSAGGERAVFKRALVVSAVIHVVLFILIVTVPSLPKPARKGMTYYVNFGGMPGGGGGGTGGGGGAARVTPPQTKLDATPTPAQRESLRDLTIPQKLEQLEPETKRYPVEKPKRDAAAKKRLEEKKAVISKPQPGLSLSDATPAPQAGAAAASGAGSGSGLRLGGLGEGSGPGGPGSGGGFGGGYGGGLGGGNFPYAYYLQIIMDKVGANWFTYRVDPGAPGNYSVQVYFRIARNGQVSGLKVEKPSGAESLDLSALRAIQSSAPFPALPSEYEDSVLIVHLIFEHAK